MEKCFVCSPGETPISERGAYNAYNVHGQNFQEEKMLTTVRCPPINHSLTKATIRYGEALTRTGKLVEQLFTLAAMFTTVGAPLGHRLCPWIKFVRGPAGAGLLIIKGLKYSCNPEAWKQGDGRIAHALKVICPALMLFNGPNNLALWIVKVRHMALPSHFMHSWQSLLSKTGLAGNVFAAALMANNIGVCVASGYKARFEAAELNGIVRATQAAGNRDLLAEREAAFRVGFDKKQTDGILGNALDFGKYAGDSLAQVVPEEASIYVSVVAASLGVIKSGIEVKGKLGSDLFGAAAQIKSWFV